MGKLTHYIFVSKAKPNMKSIRELAFPVLIAIICGFTAANMYYIQPLVPFIQENLLVSYEKASMLYSFSLTGNAVSLIFIIPAGDFYNRKNLISKLLIISIISLFVFSISSNFYSLSLSAFFIGVGTSSIPLIIASLSSGVNGKINNVGRIMAGVLFGILFSRFISSVFSTLWGWKSVYLFSDIIMLLSYIYIRIEFPESATKESKTKYLDILSSNLRSFINNPAVRYYSANGFIVMFLFASYWNNISSYLQDGFSLSQFDVGIFSLTGVAGASCALFSAPLLRILKNNSAVIMLLDLLSFAIMIFLTHYFWAAISGALFIDAFIQLSHINNQRKLYQASNGNEARAASCYMTAFVIGGASGGAISSHIYILFGWSGVLILCAMICLLSFLLKSPKENTITLPGE